MFSIFLLLLLTCFVLFANLYGHTTFVFAQQTSLLKTKRGECVLFYLESKQYKLGFLFKVMMVINARKRIKIK